MAISTKMSLPIRYSDHGSANHEEKGLLNVIADDFVGGKNDFLSVAKCTLLFPIVYFLHTQGNSQTTNDEEKHIRQARLNSTALEPNIRYETHNCSHIFRPSKLSARRRISFRAATVGHWCANTEQFRQYCYEQ